MPRRHISRALREVILDDHDPRRREERLDDDEEEEPVPFLRGRSFGTRVRIGGSSKGMWSERLSVLCAVVLSARSRGIIISHRSLPARKNGVIKRIVHRAFSLKPFPALVS